MRQATLSSRSRKAEVAAPVRAQFSAAILARRCACGNRTVSGERCDTCALHLQCKRDGTEGGDPLELEADRLAGEFSSNPASQGAGTGMARSGGGRTDAPATQHAGSASERRALQESGAPLQSDLRAELERWFGGDFSRVRVHSGDEAGRSAREAGARAFTTGSDIVFAPDQYRPGTREGRRLLAHELAHVLQQRSSTVAPAIQRQGMGDVKLAEDSDEITRQVRSTAAFRALDAEHVKLTEEIIAELAKRPAVERHGLLLKLKLLFDTPTKAAAAITAETQAGTVQAVKKEKQRVAKPAEAARTQIEEKASGDPARAGHWDRIPGKFGGGAYFVDRRSATDIVVRASIHLTPKGTGTAKDVNDIKAMEDGIEKAASTRGYLVDITFVDADTPDTFKVDVDPSKWETATNWSGGDPGGFAHELHHMFAFELDRYNYIEAHAANPSMEIGDRIYWFRQELRKPAGYNDPTSIMNSAGHPNDDDVCRVAGLDVKTCVAARQKALPH